LTTIMGGDDRFYNNIIIGRNNASDNKYGLVTYNSSKLPVWIAGNVYYNDAIPSVKDTGFQNSSGYDPGVELVKENGNGYLRITPDPAFFDHNLKLVTGDILGKAKIPKAVFENADGTAFVSDEDYFGNKRSAEANVAGPFSGLKPGKSSLKLW